MTLGNVRECAILRMRRSLADGSSLSLVPARGPSTLSVVVLKFFETSAELLSGVDAAPRRPIH